MKGRLNTWLVVLAVIFAVSMYFGRDLVRRGTGPAVGESGTTVKEVDYDLPGEETAIHLEVLNGTDEPGLAREISLMLGRAGCVVQGIGNAPARNFGHSLLINRRLPRRRAAALARRLGGVEVIREWDSRCSEDAVLVLGADHGLLTAGLAEAR